MQSKVECYAELKADVLIVFVSFRKIVFLFYVSFSVRLPKKSALFVFLANSSWKALASSLVRFRSSSPHPKKILSQYFRLNFDYSIDQTDWLRKIDKKKQGDNSKKRETRLFHQIQCFASLEWTVRISIHFKISCAPNFKAPRQLDLSGFKHAAVARAGL